MAEYGRRARLRNLIETGTYRGDMVAAQRHHFQRIWSIEIDPQLAAQAVARFAGLGSIQVLAGDSAAVLPGLLATIREPCLFWLDGHWSGGVTGRGITDTPIVEELHAILGHDVEGHVLLIDDARYFTGQGDYPSLAALGALVARHRPGWTLEVADDVIRIHG